MTRTGYSCEHMRRKNKHGCPASMQHYCSETGKYIDPISCHKTCEQFRPLVAAHCRPAKIKLEVELL